MCLEQATPNATLRAERVNSVLANERTGDQFAMNFQWPIRCETFPDPNHAGRTISEPSYRMLERTRQNLPIRKLEELPNAISPHVFSTTLCALAALGANVAAHFVTAMNAKNFEPKYPGSAYISPLTMIKWNHQARHNSEFPLEHTIMDLVMEGENQKTDSEVKYDQYLTEFFAESINK